MRRKGHFDGALLAGIQLRAARIRLCEAKRGVARRRDAGNF
jgi:hypothetical protein